jgi:hypothetical protein
VNAYVDGCRATHRACAASIAASRGSGETPAAESTDGEAVAGAEADGEAVADGEGEAGTAEDAIVHAPTSIARTALEIAVRITRSTVEARSGFPADRRAIQTAYDSFILVGTSREEMV